MTETYVTRFTRQQMIEHFITLLVFMLLCLTGLPQKFYQAGWAHTLIDLFGGIDRNRWIHRFCGVVLAISTVIHFVNASLTMLSKKVGFTMVPDRKDFEDAILQLKFYLGMTDRHPHYDRYDYKQKFEYWGLVFGNVIMVVTGFVLFFPVQFANLIPGQVIPAAKVAHSNEGLMAFFVITIWHIFNAHLNPDVFPFDASMFTGKISRKRMLHEHPLELARMEGRPVEEILATRRHMHLDEKWADILAQGIVHSLVASLFVEALTRSWAVRHPGQRIALRLVALGYPLVLFPALVLFFPERSSEPFHETALLVGRLWAEVPVGRTDLFHLFVTVLTGLGLVLFGLDVVGLVRALRRGRPPRAEPDQASALAMEAALRPLDGRPGGRPRVAFVDRPAPLLFCAGVRHPTIWISRGVVELLDPEELRAALAHETAHLERRDPERSWVMMGLRAVLCFNPIFQVVARALARDAERLADERGAELGANRLALASGIIKLHRATSGGSRRTLVFAGALAGPLRRARTLDVEQRARALLEPAPPRLPFGRLRVVLAAASVTGLLFFVV